MRTTATDSAKSLSKREYFAAKTLQGFLSNGTLLEMDSAKTYETATVAVASIAVDFADALIEALNKEKPCT